MSKVQQAIDEGLAKARWQFWGQLWRGLTAVCQRTMELSIQGAVNRRVEECLTEHGAAVVRACPACGTMERKDFRRNGSYERELTTTEGLVRVRVPRLRCRCGKSIPIEHLGFRPRQRYSFDVQLLLIELIGMRVALRPLASHLARRGIPVSPASLARMLKRLELAALGPLALSPSEISVDGMYVRLWDKERGWGGESACVLLAVNHDERLTEKVLGIVFAPAESEEAYRSLADLLLSRGMDPHAPLTVVSDGAQAIPNAFQRAFTSVRFQRCQIHLTWDVREEAPAAIRDRVERSAWWVLRGSSMEEAQRRLTEFSRRYGQDAPQSVRTLRRGFWDATLCLRTTVVQRTNGRAERYVRECRRHYRPREVFRDNDSALRRISLWAPIMNAPHTGFDWLANLFAAQLGLHRRLIEFPALVHT